MSLARYVLPDADLVTTDPEKYRPTFHYTATKGWLSDPNGMVYFDGEFHLSYQHDDYDNVFGAMSWGHAVSNDLLHWRELPKVIEPDPLLGMCFSGCTVVDKHNTSGLGANTLVGFYTSELPKQQQSMVYSTDRGRTFKKYENNPVIANTEGMSKDFRDPKVIWYEVENCWIMALAGPERIEFWSSQNLINWQVESYFGDGQGAHGGEWECPDLLHLAIDGNQQSKSWVLIVSVNPGGPNGGSGTQYFIGDFAKVDGKLTFSSPQNDVKWLDSGIDNYAGVTWANMADSVNGDCAYSIAWMNNWTYAYKTPTSQWRGVMTMIRELKLRTFKDELVLSCRPAPFYEQLQGAKLFEYQGNSKHTIINRDASVGEPLSASRVRLKFALSDSNDTGLELRNTLGQLTKIGYRKSEGVFYVDRQNCGMQNFAEGFAGEHTTKVKGELEHLEMDIYIDRCSVEVFFNDAEYAMTELIFPEEPLSVFKPFADGQAELIDLSILEMKKIQIT